MKKLLLTIFSIALMLGNTNTADAFVRYEEKNPKKKIMLTIAGMDKYAPFGWQDETEKNTFKTVFSPLMEAFYAEANIEPTYDVGRNGVDELIQKLRRGEIDIFLGSYNETELFRGTHLLFPAIVFNPITVFMLPDRINEVKSTDDLKKLKGVRNINEVFSDFVSKKISEYNPIEVQSPYEAFEKLFTREADYIITGYYNGMIEAIKLGLKKQVAPAKQHLWKIPVFIGVSKTARNREMISKRITRLLTDKNIVKKVEDHMQSIVNDFERKYSGVVPPTFGLDKISAIETETSSENKTIGENRQNNANVMQTDTVSEKMNNELDAE